MTSAAPQERLPLFELERALRPLRRVLSRGAARAAADAWFAASCARLGAPLAALELPEPLDADARELLAHLDGLGADRPDARRDRVARAWQVLQRLDDILGLPLDDPALFPPRLRRAPRSRAEPSAPAAPPVPSGREVAASPAAPEEAPAPEPARSLLQGARWDTPLAELDVPDALIEAAAEAGLETVWDALTLRPTAAEVVAPVHGAGRALPGGRVAVGGRVRGRWTVLSPSRERRSTLVLHGAGRLVCRWQHPFTPADLLRTRPGTKVVLVGDHEEPDLSGAQLASGWHGKAFRASYTGLPEPGAVGDLVRLLLDDVEALDDVVPAGLLEQRGLARLPDAVLRAHTRAGDEDAGRRLAFDEALFVQLGLSHARFEPAHEPGISHAVAHLHVTELQTRDALPPLDDDAQLALEAIKRDLRSGAPMARVLCGDAAAPVDDVVLQALLTVAETRSQVLVVAPDAPSAAVLHGRWDELLRSFGVHPALVAGEPRRADRDALRRGELHVVFGAPGVFDLGLDWRRLGLVVAVEQARYGDVPLRVRAMRAPRPDLLVVARTPLPIPVLLGAYPSFDVTWLRAGGAVAGGTVWGEPQREAAYRTLGEAVRAGRPALVAFPMRRGGTDLLALREVDSLIHTLKTQFLGEVQALPFHGAMQPAERQRAWTDFVERRAGVLVATTTLECMPPAPRGVVALVEHADRMDLQRLLGFRALVTGQGHLHYVVGAEPNARGVARVEQLAAQAPDHQVIGAGDAFEVAEVCGPAPAPRFRWLADADAALLLAARAEAHRLYREEPGLRQDASPRLMRLAHLGWQRLLPEADNPLPVPRDLGPSRKRRRRRRRR